MTFMAQQGLCGVWESWVAWTDIGPQAATPLPERGPQRLPWFCRAVAAARPGSWVCVHVYPPPGPWWQVSPGPGTRTGSSGLRLLGAPALQEQEGSQKAWRKFNSPLQWVMAVGMDGRLSELGGHEGRSGEEALGKL